jgi:hypothetical protein
VNDRVSLPSGVSDHGEKRVDFLRERLEFITFSQLDVFNAFTFQKPIQNCLQPVKRARDSVFS